MADGGFVRLPDGSVVVALSVPRPGAPDRVRVLVHAANRPRALTRLRNLGLRSVYLRGNAAPPTPDEISAVLHHPEGVVWCGRPDDDTEGWHPMAALLGRPGRPRERPVDRPQGPSQGPPPGRPLELPQDRPLGRSLGRQGAA